MIHTTLSQCLTVWSKHTYTSSTLSFNYMSFHYEYISAFLQSQASNFPDSGPSIEIGGMASSMHLGKFYQNPSTLLIIWDTCRVTKVRWELAELLCCFEPLILQNSTPKLDKIYRHLWSRKEYIWHAEYSIKVLSIKLGIFFKIINTLNNGFSIKDNQCIREYLTMTLTLNFSNFCFLEYI